MRFVAGLTISALAIWGAPALAAAEIRSFVVSVQARKVDAAQRTLRIRQGDAAEIKFTVDERVELHLHGYDLLLTAEPGSVAVMRVEGKIAGRFPIEAHRFGGTAGKGRTRGHVVLLYLEVHPP